MLKTSKTPVKMLSGLLVAASLVGGSAALADDSSATAQTGNHAQIGTLKCDVSGGIGLILGSKKEMTCTFNKNDGTTEEYTGNVLKIGVDVGYTHESVLLWAVLAPSGKHDVGGMAGRYTGAGAEATAVGGVGANLLFSAGNNFTLQPLSVQGQTGLNVAAGVSSIKLDYKG